MRGDNEELYTRALRCINNNQLAEAESTLSEALAVAEESYGPKHAETAQCLMMLGIVLEKEGKLAAAEVKLRRCANIRKELFGEDSSVFGISLNVLASAVAAQGGEKLEEGENLFKKCVDHAERVLGHVHPNTAVAYLQLGRTQVMADKMEEAERSLRTCVAIQTEALGRNHPETIKALGMYSEALRKLAKTEQADEIEREMQDLEAIESFNVLEGDRGRPVEQSGPKQQSM